LGPHELTVSYSVERDHKPHLHSPDNSNSELHLFRLFALSADSYIVWDEERKKNGSYLAFSLNGIDGSLQLYPEDIVALYDYTGGKKTPQNEQVVSVLNEHLQAFRRHNLLLSPTDTGTDENSTLNKSEFKKLKMELQSAQNGGLTEWDFIKRIREMHILNDKSASKIIISDIGTNFKALQNLAQKLSLPFQTILIPFESKQLFPTEENIQQILNNVDVSGNLQMEIQELIMAYMREEQIRIWGEIKKQLNEGYGKKTPKKLYLLDSYFDIGGDDPFNYDTLRTRYPEIKNVYTTISRLLDFARDRLSILSVQVNQPTNSTLLLPSIVH
jgi:hypothetical protein